MNERAERGRLGQLGPQDPPRIGAYRLLGRLGEGGMGRVYLARSDRGRTVAVKLVKTELSGQDDFRARFRQEVQAARRVGGEWTAPVLDADTEAATPWVATGYIAGPSLRQVITEGRTPLPERSVRILAGGLAGALRSIHAAGIVHRDLKPSNILLTIDGPKVIDFGIARALEAVTVEGGLTRTNQAVGSPGFMSPEQVRGRPVTPASDVFCLGSVLMFAATGRLPFGTSDSGVHALMYRIAQEDPDLTGLPYGLHSLVAACLAKDPAQRPTPDQLIAYTGSEDDGQEPWLPGALIAELGRHAVELLDAENPNGAWEEPGDASWDGSGGHRAWESADGSWGHSGAARDREQTPTPAPGPVSAPLPPQVPGSATPPPYAAAGAPAPAPAASDATVAPPPGPPPTAAAARAPQAAPDSATIRVRAVTVETAATVRTAAVPAPPAAAAPPQPPLHRPPPYPHPRPGRRRRSRPRHRRHRHRLRLVQPRRGRRERREGRRRHRDRGGRQGRQGGGQGARRHPAAVPGHLGDQARQGRQRHLPLHRHPGRGRRHRPGHGGARRQLPLRVQGHPHERRAAAAPRPDHRRGGPGDQLQPGRPQHPAPATRRQAPPGLRRRQADLHVHEEGLMPAPAGHGGAGSGHPYDVTADPWHGLLARRLGATRDSSRALVLRSRALIEENHRLLDENYRLRQQRASIVGSAQDRR
ncbi:serine/threonine-protein kinase [Streptomyces sp. Ac-502]|uniref:serine/threonine-protein kinase n=1 Tax=Streptomyces sp. Ac-502 TaxID=3342801 RepID=UPI00386221B3